MPQSRQGNSRRQDREGKCDNGCCSQVSWAGKVHPGKNSNKAQSWGCHWTRMDAVWRRGASCRGDCNARKGEAYTDRKPWRCDERISANSAIICPLTRLRTRDRRGNIRQKRCAHSCPSRRDSQRWTIGRRNDDHSVGFAARRSSAQRGHSDDR